MADTDQEPSIDGPFTLTADQLAGHMVYDPQPEYALAIRGEGGAWLVGIRPDGSIRYGDGYTPDEAARQFWEAMSRLMPARCGNCGHFPGSQT